MRRVVLAFLGLLVLGETARAGALGVTPTRIELSAGRTAGAVTVRNEADRPVMVQVETFAWVDGPFVADLEPTRELIAVPPLFELPAGGQQVVRVARRRPLEGAREVAYRLLISEVPRPAEESGNAVRLALRLSLPIFATPPGAAPDPRFELRRVGGGLRLAMANRGSAHLHVWRLVLLDASGRRIAAVETPTYVLPGRSHQWDISTPATALGSTYLKAETSIGELDISLRIVDG